MDTGVRRALADARGADVIIKASGVGVFDTLLEQEVLTMQSPSRRVVFWDVDAPATLDRVQQHAAGPFRQCIPAYDLVLTYGGGEPVVQWPDNVQRIEHLPPAAHCSFYNAQRFTLNLTRADMVRTGYAPSVRLFEAAACATPIISDYWPGLETFFTPGKEILISQSPQDTLRYLRHLSTEERGRLSESARRRVLAEHTAAHRAKALEHYLIQAMEHRRGHAS